MTDLSSTFYRTAKSFSTNRKPQDHMFNNLIAQISDYQRPNQRPQTTNIPKRPQPPLPTTNRPNTTAYRRNRMYDLDEPFYLRLYPERPQQDEKFKLIQIREKAIMRRRHSKPCSSEIKERVRNRLNQSHDDRNDTEDYRKVRFQDDEDDDHYKNNKIVDRIASKGEQREVDWFKKFENILDVRKKVLMEQHKENQSSLIQKRMDYQAKQKYYQKTSFSSEKMKKFMINDKRRFSKF